MQTSVYFSLLILLIMLTGILIYPFSILTTLSHDTSQSITDNVSVINPDPEKGVFFFEVESQFYLVNQN